MAGLSLKLDRTRLNGYLQRLSRRERMMLVGLALAASTLAPIKAYAWRQAQLSALLDDAVSLQALRQRDDPAQLGRVARQLTEQQRRLKAWSWTSSSFAVARVLVEQEVATAAVKAGMTDPDVQASDQPDQVGAARFVRLELSGPFTWPIFAGLMQRLSATGKGLIVDSVSVEQDGGGAQLHLVALLPFSAPDHEPSR